MNNFIRSVKKNNFELMLDAPRTKLQSVSKITVKGWMVSLGATVKSMRIVKDDYIADLNYGLSRDDVTKARPHYPRNRTANCGFEAVVDIEDGDYRIEADFGFGYFEVMKLSLSYKHIEPNDYFNPRLSLNSMKHQAIMDARKQYYYQPEAIHSYERAQEDPRLVAFYLPQFHPIKQNDETWGKGFTEWTNVSQGSPRFVGHEQPLLPSDLGFYDLRSEQSVKDQIELAKKYGIYGFCIYYYWFSGEKILDTPINHIMKHKEWDFNFMICWANENWTKRWDGHDEDVIIAQKYKESDPIDFIKDIEDILLDERYIRENGKPVLAVYRGSELGDPERYIKVWRDYFKEKHGQELHIVTMMNFDLSDQRKHGFDKGIEFSPLTTYKRGDYKRDLAVYPDLRDDLLDINYEGSVVDYRSVLPSINTFEPFPFPTYKCISPSWDNDARKKGRKSGVFYNATPNAYGQWLDDAIKESLSSQEAPLVFVNAWNEWGEGAVLEPTLRYGHANLLKTAEILSKYSGNVINKNHFPINRSSLEVKSEIAILVHVFYEREWEYISQKLKNLITPFDLYISLSPEVWSLRAEIEEAHPGVLIQDVPNMGRDVLPFVMQYYMIAHKNYKHVLKLHTKRTVHRKDGWKWFRQLVDGLIGDDKTVENIQKSLSDTYDMVGVSGHYISYKSNTVDKKDIQLIDRYLTKISDGLTLASIDDSTGFFAGTMFWANRDTLSFLNRLMLSPNDFDPELGQKDGTTAHAMERIFGIVPYLQKKRIGQVIDGQVTTAAIDKQATVYAFNSREGKIPHMVPLCATVENPYGELEILQSKNKALAWEVVVLNKRLNSHPYRVLRKILRPVRKLLKAGKRIKRIYVKGKERWVIRSLVRHYYGIRLIGGSPKVILVVRDANFPTSSTYIRLFSPLRIIINKIGSVDLVDMRTIKLKQSIDVIIVQRTAVDTLENAKKIVDWTKKNNKNLFVDTDDAFGELDRNHPQYALQMQRVEALNYLIANAAAVWTSTAELRKLQNTSAPIKVIRNTIDVKLWPRLSEEKINRIPIKMPLRIVYMGTVTHSEDFAVIIPVLERLARDYPKEFELHLIGVATDVPAYPWLVVHSPPKAMYPEFVEWFNELPQFDIGLSPLEDSAFNKNKSDIKCLDYLACGIKPVVSDVEAYKNKELDELIVRVANTEEAWYLALEKEIKNKEKNRKNMQNKARQGFDYILAKRSTYIAATSILEGLEGNLKKDKK